MNCDIVVVGCGVAGLSAALSAKTNGARVELLERAPKDQRGGNSEYTEAYFRMPNETEISEDFEDKLANSAMGTIDPVMLQETIQPYEKWSPLLKGYGFTDPELISAFAEGVPESIALLKTLGVTFLEASPFLTQKTQRIAPSGGGAALVAALGEAAEEAGVHFNYEMTAVSLVQDELGNIKGLNAWSKETGMIRFNAKAVILACGGFQGNLEMMAKYVGQHSHLTRPVAPGGLYNKGEGVEMALSVGAAPAGQYDAFHAETIDPRSGRPEASIFIFGYGILVNQSGRRFIDEASGLSDTIYEEVARAILKQEGGIAYLIFDSKLYDVPNYQKGLHTDREPIKATSICDLAQQLKIDPLALEETIYSYNAAVQPGEFKPFVLDGKCTKGISPPKTNWANKIAEGDLMALPIMCANVFTFGGVKITPDGEVLNRDGYVIPGLYAAGEVIGLYYGSYVGSTSVLRGLVFGRKAGQRAAAKCEEVS